MDIEQLKIVLSMVQTVTDGAMYVLIAWLGVKVLHIVAVVLCVWLVVRGIVRLVAVVHNEDDLRYLRQRLLPYRLGEYTNEDHARVMRSVNAILDAAEEDKLKS